MATLKRFLETAIAKVSMRKLTTFGTGVDISTAVSNTGWIQPNYTPPSDGTIVFRTTRCKEAYLGWHGDGWWGYRFSTDELDGGNLVIPVQKGKSIAIWCRFISSTTSDPHIESAIFYPFV